jgi:hypothetical protein
VPRGQRQEASAFKKMPKKKAVHNIGALTKPQDKKLKKRLNMKTIVYK